MRSSCMKSVLAVACAAAAWSLDGRAVSAPADDVGQEMGIRVSECLVKFVDQVVLAADRAGIIASIGLEEGDRVDKGRTVATLRDEVARAAYSIAEHKAKNDVDVRFARKSSEVAWAEYQKAVKTNQRAPNTVPEVEVLRLRLAAERSDLQIEQAQHELATSALDREAARAELTTYAIEAPVTGVVTRKYKAVGEAVRQGEPIVELVNPNRLRVEGFVDPKDAWNIQPRNPVTVQLDIPGLSEAAEQATFEGHVVFVDVSVQPVTRKVRVRAEVVNENGILRAGLTARMTIISGAKATQDAADGKR